MEAGAEVSASYNRADTRVRPYAPLTPASPPEAGGEGVKGPQAGSLCHYERATQRVAPTGNGRGKGGHTGPPLRKTQNWELATDYWLLFFIKGVAFRF
jgi:hypothetical protein